MSYIDGFLIPVTIADKEAYRVKAAKCAALLKKFGAIRIVENGGDNVPDNCLPLHQADVFQPPPILNVEPLEELVLVTSTLPAHRLQRPQPEDPHD